MKTMQAIMILACRRHVSRVCWILDEACLDDWTVLPATQSRRAGFLQYVQGRHPEGSDTIYAFGEREVIAGVLAHLQQHRAAGELCPECVAYTWDVTLALPACAALDLVNREVVDHHSAPSAEHEGKTYYFASDENRDAFLLQPDLYLRRHREQQIGRRDLLPLAS